MKFYLVGGFLGSGKTTAIKQACAALRKAGVHAAVVTNDQGEQLVDTAFLASDNVPVAQITNGCFCCRYTELAAAVDSIKSTENPDVIFAESVGSCTDLIATVAKPLQAQDPESTVVISIFADASLLFPMLTGKASFLNDDVRYIYKKQLDEADILVVSKIDSLAAEELAFLIPAIEEQYAAKQLLFHNSFDETHIARWLQAMEQHQVSGKRKSLQIDYETYARGEAAMAWLDEELEIESKGNASAVAYRILDDLQSAVRKAGLQIGHLKFLLDDGTRQQKISFTTTAGDQLLTNFFPPSKRLRLLINARVQAAPELLQGLVETVVDEVMTRESVSITVKSIAAFRPGYPTPLHRVAD